MRARLFIAGVAAVAIAGVSIYGVQQLSNPDLPSRQKVDRTQNLPQGWSDEDRTRYHFTSQGTLLMPLAWLRAMDSGFFSSRKLVDPEILAGLRQVTDGEPPSKSWNAAGLPVGWTVDEWTAPTQPPGPKLAKVGFNCSACHTGQLNYRGTAIRVEGGGSLQDAGSLQEMVGKAVVATQWLPWKRSRFLDEVTAATGESRAEVSAMLDAADDTALAAISRSIPSHQYVREGYGRLDALQRIANTVFADDLHEDANNHHGDGAVKYPYLWDIWRLDWVQYNASVRQPMVRNVGEALGVRAETNMVDAAGKPIAEPERWDSSVNVRNLQWMEDTLERLKPPAWPEPILGKLNVANVARGRELFTQHCAGCHEIKVDRSHTPSEWRVTQIPVTEIGTDPNTAENFVKNVYSGAKLGKTAPLHAGDALSFLTEAIKERQYSLLKFTVEQQRAADGFGRNNLVINDRAVYKARPLVGIWATPPYLHNGSVPTLYDLLSPERPKQFYVGTREYDPEHVGYETSNFPGAQLFDTAVSGNSNLGHWFVSDARPGRLGPELAVHDRIALIEYLKETTYADYPCIDAVSHAAADGADCGRDAPPANKHG
jgi:mono/diheme cytochrome c family protein